MIWNEDATEDLEIESDEEEPICSCCEYETKDLKEYEMGGKKGQLCKCCASTFAGNSFFYPSQYPNSNIMKQISYCTNMILDEIRKGNISHV
jgi:predicted amidophosphoribosyltransferase